MNQSIRVGTGLSAQDERAISAVVIAYATGIDRRDWHLLHSCFTIDCEADYGPFGRLHGAAAITDYMKHAHADLGATLHRISNIVIHSADGQVHARSYVDALIKTANEGGPLHRGVGHYDDQLIRTANGWQIARRQFHALLLE